MHPTHDIKAKAREMFFEKCAEIEHIRWANWQKHVFSKCIVVDEKGLAIPREFVERWQRQINTPYAELSELEKQSDRREVETYWKFIDTIIDLATQAERERISENVSKLREEIINESWARNTNQYLSKKEVENALK